MWCQCKKQNDVLIWIAVASLLIFANCTSRVDQVRQIPAAVPSIMTDDVAWQVKLENLARDLESNRQQHHIPGMAIAVVKDDAVIFARGFGFADLENNVPADPGTMFAVGSTTKAFTSALTAMMVDEGRLSWDDPIDKHLPYMKLNPDLNGTEGAVTIRDMLAHRTGFTRMGILWAGGQSSRQEILTEASQAEPWDSFRDSFNYNNVMYLGAGVAVAQAAKTNWDDMLKQRLLIPLGMAKTNSSYAQAQASNRLASGYQWDSENKTHKRLPMRNIDSIGPAGSINANVLDMTRWLRFQMDNGRFEGRRLVSEKQLLETRSSQIELSSDLSYGMGWFIQSWQGQPVIQHGGNIDGYAAMVAFAPDSSLGFVLLTNTTANPLQNLSINMVFDHLLGEKQEQVVKKQKPTNPEAEFEPYVGEYIANFGPFENATMKVLVQNDRLAVDVPGQTIYELHPENEEGKWVFTLTDTIAVSFAKDESGAILFMRLHQAGFDFELPRKGVPIKPEIDQAELTKYLGSYYSEKHKVTVSVIIQNHRLTLKMNEKLPFELHLPDEQGRRKLRIRKNSHVVFNEAEDGRIISISRYRDGELKEEMKRVEADIPPTLADVLALRKTEQIITRIKEWGDYRLSGSLKFVNAGVSGKFNLDGRGLDRYLMSLDLGKYGLIQTFATPQASATKSSQNPFEKHVGKFLDQSRKGHMALPFLDWRELYEKVEVIGVKQEDEQKMIVVRLSGGETPATTLFLDQTTGDVLKQESQVMHPSVGAFDATVFFEDYREVEGIRIPFITRTRNQLIGEIAFTVQELQIKQGFKDSHYHLEETTSK